MSTPHPPALAGMAGERPHLPAPPAAFIRRATRGLWRGWLRIRYRLFQGHRHDRLVLEHAAGRPLLVLPRVFNPTLFRSGEFLAEVLDGGVAPTGATVLDLGTGSGIGALAAASGAARVLAIDVNPEACRCARINALLNRVEERVEVRTGDLFEPAGGERFDLVLFNPPYYAGEPAGGLDQAFYGGDTGRRFAAGLRGHLRPGGSAVLVLSDAGDEALFLDPLREQGFAFTILAERRFPHETLTAYRVRVEEG